MGEAKTQLQQDTAPHPKGSYMPQRHQEGMVPSQASAETWLKQLILNHLQKKSTECQQNHTFKGTMVCEFLLLRSEALLKWDPDPHFWVLHLRKPLMARPGQKLC